MKQASTDDTASDHPTIAQTATSDTNSVETPLTRAFAAGGIPLTIRAQLQ